MWTPTSQMPRSRQKKRKEGAEMKPEDVVNWPAREST